MISTAACGDDGGPDPDPDSSSTPDSTLVPITGEWYRPAVASTWQWQLVGAVNTDYAVDLYDIDLFDTPRR